VLRADAISTGASTSRRIAWLAGAVVAGSVAYCAAWAGFEYFNRSMAPARHYHEIVLERFVRGVALGGLPTAALYWAARERRATRDLRQGRMTHAEIERELAEARLLALRSQIEPHFLFNSLATIKRLYEGRPGEARAMLRHLRAYLQAALSLAEKPEARLRDEVALARAFLEICTARMGGRLEVRVDVPAELEEVVVPALMVGTLVENAVKHGIAPRASGGRVSLTACRQGDFVELAVEDDGVGFRAQRGDGVGLANIRARLEHWCGGTGRLQLAANPGGGVKATLRIPHRVGALSR
jgi:LytS/YehU family sensor histidine kinase